MSTPLWTSKAMSEAMRAACQGAVPDVVTGLSIDSRSILPGQAYFAIKGDVHDGHDFVDAALKAGAVLAVVEKAQATKFAQRAPLLVVDDVLEGLRDLARAARIASAIAFEVQSGGLMRSSAPMRPRPRRDR